MLPLASLLLMYTAKIIIEKSPRAGNLTITCIHCQKRVVLCYYTSLYSDNMLVGGAASRSK